MGALASLTNAKHLGFLISLLRCRARGEVAVMGLESCTQSNDKNGFKVIKTIMCQKLLTIN